MEQGFTDIHTHILPSIDDGAQSVEAALELLCLQKNSGVERVMLTPHFYPQIEELPGFLARRERAYSDLLAHWEADTMPRLQLGAEVHYSPALVEMDLEQLTLGTGKYMLLEMPDFEVPTYVEQVVERILQMGITPILAHVERSAYFRDQPETLLCLVQMGALGQISTRALKDIRDRHFGENCIKNGLGHFIASDLHGKNRKDICLGELAEGKYKELLAWTESFAQAVWNNTQLPSFVVRPVKKCILGYHG